ncbi:MAG: hypothetical protein ABEI86_07645, partial [Halobacteriaceae archaeon]
MDQGLSGNGIYSPSGMRLAKAVFLGLIILVGSITTGGVSLAKSPKFVESDITSDTRWTRSEGPFRIIEPIKVKNNVTLIIEAGTRVEFASGAKLVVKGNLTAGQNGDRRVIFTSSKPSPKPGAWGGIELFGPTEIAQNPSGFVNGTVNFDGVSIRYATTGLEVWKTGTAILTNVRISNVSESGIAVTRRGELRIHNSIINKGITPGIVFGGVNPRYLKISSSIVNG